MLIDTHSHLDFENLFENIDEVLYRAKEAGVEKFIIPAASYKTLSNAISLSEKYEDIYFSVGTHPNDAFEYKRDRLTKEIEHPKCIAVGECGLDYHYLPKDECQKEKIKAKQKEVFISQIELAIEYKKPLIVHIRDASADSKEILLRHAKKCISAILHCYNADEQLLSLAKDEFYFGIGGVVTFKNARKLVEILPKIPKDRLVLETDAPFLTPHPFRGERNEPSFLPIIAQKIAELLDMSEDDVCNMTTRNAKRIFKEL